jgi:hypothetical protein
VRWEAFTDEALLDLRFCDLGVSLENSPLRAAVERWYAALGRLGVRFRPHCWVGEEWFSPDGVPGFAVPFYLAHPRLRALERRMMGQVEGGDPVWLMRLLRHETGHTIDTAYRLRHRPDWRAYFGSASLPYPLHYRARPGSRRYVQHLGGWYAQSHPTEDFAETFAVWSGSDRAWRTHYADWPARRKLEYVDRLMARLGPRAAPVRARVFVEPIADKSLTLREHYSRMQGLYGDGAYRPLDALLRRWFSARATAGSTSAINRLKASRRRLLAKMVAVTGCSEYVARQVMAETTTRCRQLGLGWVRSRVSMAVIEDDMVGLTQRLLRGSRTFPL